jgi:hypothetical protein
VTHKEGHPKLKWSGFATQTHENVIKIPYPKLLLSFFSLSVSLRFFFYLSLKEKRKRGMREGKMHTCNSSEWPKTMPMSRLAANG